MRFNLVAFVLICLAAVCTFANAKPLSQLDIDLLVGAPVDVKEPLDERRTKSSEPKKLDFADFIEIPNEEIDFGLEQWAINEPEAQGSDKIEAQYLDMLCEDETFFGYTDENIGALSKAETTNGEAFNAAAANAKAINGEAFNAAAPNAEAINNEAFDAAATNGEAFNAEAPNAEAINNEAFDAAAPNAKAINAAADETTKNNENFEVNSSDNVETEFKL